MNLLQGRLMIPKSLVHCAECINYLAVYQVQYIYIYSTIICNISGTIYWVQFMYVKLVT